MFSVWNWKTGKYDYYQAPAQTALGYGDEVKPPVKNGMSGWLGDDPDMAGHILPPGSKAVGSGDVAMGEIAAIEEERVGMSPWIAAGLAVTIPTVILWLTINLGKLVSK
jgi:hypothetical protein